MACVCRSWVAAVPALLCVCSRGERGSGLLGALHGLSWGQGDREGCGRQPVALWWLLWLTECKEMTLASASCTAGQWQHCWPCCSLSGEFSCQGPALAISRVRPDSTLEIWIETQSPQGLWRQPNRGVVREGVSCRKSQDSRSVVTRQQYLCEWNIVLQLLEIGSLRSWNTNPNMLWLSQ